MSTRLANIISVAEESVPSSKAEDILQWIGQTLDSRKSEAVIEVVRMYNAELSRILYAFSSFEKDVEYDSENDVYRVRVCLLGDEYEYLLSKLRFLGKRVRVVEGDYLKKRMLESSTKALERYGVIASNEELSS
jgi:predicted DNA-binding transcriptional regulator YafY